MEKHKQYLLLDWLWNVYLWLVRIYVGKTSMISFSIQNTYGHGNISYKMDDRNLNNPINTFFEKKRVFRFLGFIGSGYKW